LNLSAGERLARATLTNADRAGDRFTPFVIPISSLMREFGFRHFAPPKIAGATFCLEQHPTTCYTKRQAT
jgi:hypothetical protein